MAPSKGPDPIPSQVIRTRNCNCTPHYLPVGNFILMFRSPLSTRLLLLLPCISPETEAEAVHAPDPEQNTPPVLLSFVAVSLSLLSHCIAAPASVTGTGNVVKPQNQLQPRPQVGYKYATRDNNGRWVWFGRFENCWRMKRWNVLDFKCDRIGDGGGGGG